MSTHHNALPSGRETDLAKTSSQELSAYIAADDVVQNLVIQDKTGEQHQIQVPVSALKAFVDLLTYLGEGNSVSLTPTHAEMTTQEAADYLHISRPTLIKLLEDGIIPFHHAGNRRKVRFQDVQQYKQDLQEQRLSTLDELSALDQDLDMGYDK